MIYSKQQVVSSSLVGADAKLSYIGLFDVVEDAITEAMGALHLDGVTVKREYNAFWVFTKNKIVLFDSLAWGERFCVESFVSSVSAAKMTVDTALKRCDGTLVAYSCCEMCVLDLQTFRIRRTSTVGIGADFTVESPQYAVSFGKIDVADLPQVDSATVRSTNVDYSQHCNNVEYLRFLFNTYTVSELKSLNVREIEVNYISQAFEGDVLHVCKRQQGDVHTLAITREDKLVASCQIVLGR